MAKTKIKPKPTLSEGVEGPRPYTPYVPPVKGKTEPKKANDPPEGR